MFNDRWKYALAHPRSRKVIIVTVNADGIDPFDDSVHLASHPGSYCLSTHTNVEVTDPRNSRRIQVRPYIAAWPPISKKFSPLERRAEIASTQVEVLSESGLADRIASASQVASYRIDLWTDGIALRDVYPLMAGRIGEAPIRPRIGGGISFTAIDADTLKNRTTIGLLSRDLVPDAPDDVIDTQRSFVVGAYFYRQIGRQIDREGTLFYLHDGKASVPPTRVEKGGLPIDANEWEVVYPMLGGKVLATCIRLLRPVRQLAPGISDIISASGGAGIPDKSAIEVLADLAGWKLSPRAQSVIPRLRQMFPTSALFGTEDTDIMELIAGRFASQTNCVATLDRGQLDLIPIDYSGNPQILQINDDLIYRIPGETTETSATDVYSQIEIQCSRDHFGSTVDRAKPLYRVLRSPTTGPSDTQRLLARARAAIGVDRPLVITANDLLVRIDGNFQPVACPAGEELADLEAKLRCFPHKIHSYKTKWSTGLECIRGERRTIVDPNEELNGENCMVIEQLLPDESGPIVTFMTEDVES